MISKNLIEAILAQYELPTVGRHGVSHWARVIENGSRLAGLTGAKVEVVEFFAIFHDSKRVNEAVDPGHGARGAEYASSLRGTLFDLADADFALLTEACLHHTDGRTDGDVTVQACWDSDRLDLGRIGLKPDPSYLCTDAAKTPELIDWAEARGREMIVPAFIRTQWGIDLGSVRGPS